MNLVICQAIRDARCLSVHYDGYTRTVEVHAYGRTAEGNDIMRVYQVAGMSNSGELGWKIMRLDETRAIQLLAEGSRAPRNGYRRGDKAMQRIYCEV